MRSLSVCPGDHPNDAEVAATVAIGGQPVRFALHRVQPLEFTPGNPDDQRKVLVRIRAFSLNFRDKAILLAASRDASSPPVPIGSEFVGEVVACGGAVPDLRPGDRVISNASYPDSGHLGLLPGVPTNGASQELRVFDHAKLFKIPDSLPDNVAAAFTIGAQTTYSLVRRLKLRQGDNVLVTAARSNTSLFAIEALRQHPVNVFGLTTSDQHHDRLLALGVKGVLRYDPQVASFAESPEVASAARAIGGFNVVIDPFADLHLGRVVDVMAFFGRYTTCGVYDQYTHLTGEQFAYRGKGGMDLLSTIFMKNLSVIGNCLGHREDLRRAVADYDAGRLSVIIDSVFGGRDIGAFLERTYNASDRFGKVVYAYEKN